MSGVIEEEWLRAVTGKPLFYPAAGDDTIALIEAFAPHVQEFHFNDLNYSTASDRSRSAPARFRRISTGRPDAVLRNDPIRIPSSSKRYRHVNASVLTERLSDGQTTVVVRRRRGFGQYALAEFPVRSIGTFVHRCDSRGESGSDTWFLANRRRDHEPLSKLWDKLSMRLADRAIIVSDGSLSTFKFLIAASNCADISQIPTTLHGGFEWRCIGQMTDHRGGLVWGVERQ